MSVRAKVLSTDLDAWNHPRVAMALIPLFALVGATVGYLVMPHVVDSRLQEGIGTALFCGATVFLGLALFAFVD